MSKVKLTIIILVVFIVGLFLGPSLLSRVKISSFSLFKDKFSESESISSKEKAYIKFVGLEAPKQVKQGESFIINAYFMPQRRIEGRYKLFVHLYTGSGKGWINADRYPVPASNEWLPNQETKIGPIQIFIAENAPLGTYNIEMGLFYSEKIDEKPRYIRLPYTNIKGHIVGKIKVVKAEKVSESSILNKLFVQAKAKQGLSDYCVGVETPLKKVFRQIAKFSSPIANEVNISAARNEYESFQLVLVSLNKNLENVKVLATPLRQKEGQAIIDIKNIIFNPVGYVKTINPDYPVEFVGSWPDPLTKDNTANVMKGEVQPLWFTIYVPSDTPSGNYEGFIELRPNNSKNFKLKLNLKVYDFNMPVQFHLKTAFDLYGNYISKYYDVQGDDLKQMELVFYANMLKHHISPIYFYDNPREDRDKGGALFLDFSDYDRYMQFCLDRGLTAFSIVRKWGGENDNKWGTEKQIRETLTSYADYLKMRNLFDMAYIYVFDEPKIINADKIRKITKLIHEVNPNLKTLVTIQPDEIWGEDIDIWCPHLINFRQDIAEQERAKEKQVWWYVSGVRPGTPAFNIDQPAIEHRILFWLNWKYKVDGLLYWCINYWKKNPWENSETWPNQNGNGCLLYPGNDGPVDTIRIRVIQDGIEDYEYLYILDKLTKHLKANNQAPELVAEAEKILPVDTKIVKSTIEYTKVPELIIKERQRIADLIEQAIKILRQKE